MKSVLADDKGNCLCLQSVNSEAQSRSETYEGEDAETEPSAGTVILHLHS